MADADRNPKSPAGSATERRPRNARGEGDKLREEILQATLRLIADESRMQIAPLSLREVAREAGVTAPAIYRHFADREELSRAAVSALHEQLLDEMGRAEETSAGHSPARRLTEIAHAYCRFAQNNPASFRVMFGNRNHHRHERQRLADHWRIAVARLAETGIRMTQTPEAAAVSVWSAVHGRLLLEDSTTDEWDLGDVHDFVDELIRSIATAESHATPLTETAP
ncbi:TetR/AcrR family transcriptional regulator [Streptomyces sp. BV286]|uniref:TetR/AcrR family transcriptional regulator n=1 Tax=Streptomyces sp. BV286 TaxID=2849672 RepID=UPI001C2E033B|nr:TetR/AcrR family transcriptional regulator [Streptomyces sp. BV286]MBV1935618.1 TetR/AcrR family transcriptional regulator [Streptomyces sp. BV286]